MSQPSNFTDKATEKATELAGKAAEAAGPLKDKAAELAGKAAEAAGPLKDKATELAGKAAEAAAEGISSLATTIDKATHGKYSEQISAVTSKLGDRLDQGKNSDEQSDPEQ